MKAKIDNNNIKDIYRLSPMQEGMYFQWVYDPEDTAYIEQFSYRLAGSLDMGVVRRSLETLIARHDVLRTVFNHKKMDRPLQVVLKEQPVDLSFQDVTDKSPKEAEGIVEAFKQADRLQPFDLQQDVLMRISVIKTGPQSCEFTWTFHHILMDGWCIALLTGEYGRIYDALSKGQTPDLPAVPRYRSYIEWLDKQNTAVSLAFWKDYTADYESQSAFERYKKQKEGYRQQSHLFSLDVANTRSLQALASELNVTVSTLFQAVWAILLQKYTGSSDVLFGNVVSGRPASLPAVESMIGLFINTLPVRVKLADNESFRDFVKRFQKEIIQTEAHQYLPLASILKQMEGGREQPDHIIVFENFPVEKEVSQQANAKDDLEILNVDSFEQTPYDLNVIVRPEEQLHIEFNINANRFTPEMVVQLGKHLLHLMAQVIEAPVNTLESLSIVSAGEEHKVLHQFNQTQSPYPKDETLVSLFEKQAAAHPEKTALSFQRHSLRYRELNSKANQLAHWLQKHENVAPGQVIGICFDRSPEMVMAMLAIMKSGAAYMPIDPDFPVERIRRMVEISGAATVLTGKGLADLFSDINVSTADIAELVQEDSNHSVNPQVTVSPYDLAYVIFTSGSTGQPKGVMVPHRGVVNRIDWQWKALGFTAEDVILQKTNYIFDVSVWEFFMTLCFGARLVLCSKETAYDPDWLLDVVEQNGITTLHFVPTMLNAFLQQLNRENITKAGSLKRIVASGEALLPEMVAQHYSKLAIPLYNLYGPTEASVDVSYYLTRPEGTVVPIGKPIANTQLYILDQSLRPLPVGVEGEIAIGGTGLATGYINAPELTAERFVENPYSKGGKLYLTGDTGYWTESGEIIYTGRADRQVKIKGYRIEPGEIERTLLKMEGVENAAVIVSGGEVPELAGFYTGKAFETSSLKTQLASFLPAYMVPSYLVHLEEMPLTASGKTDRRTLAKQVHGEQASGTEYVAPASEAEKELAAIWAEELGRKTVGIHDDYFAIGGDSIKAIRVISRANKKLEVNLEVRDLFAHPTIAALAGMAEGGEVSHREADKLAISRELEVFKKEILEDPKRVNQLPDSWEDFYPMSDIEKGMVFHHMMGKAEGVYQDQFYYPFDDAGFDINRFEKALRLLIQKHEALRTCFRLSGFETPLHVVCKAKDFSPAFTLEDLSHLSSAEQQTALGNLTDNDRLTQLDHESPGLWRLRLIRLGSKDFGVLFTFHHAILDGWSMAAFIAELSDTYEKLSESETFVPAPLQASYRDYIIEQRLALNADAQNWWKNYLGGYERTAIPLGKTVPHYSGQVNRHVQAIPGNIAQAVLETSRRTGTGIQEVCLAAYAGMMKVSTNADDLTFGLVTQGRPEMTDGDKVLGCFLNTLPFRIQLGKALTSKSLLNQIRQQARELKHYEKMSLLETARLLGEEAGGNPFFDHFFYYVDFNQSERNTEGHGDNADAFVHGFENTNTYFDFGISRIGDNLGITLNYADGLYTKEEIERLNGYFINILAALCSTEEVKLSHEVYLSDNEVDILLNKWASSHKDVTANGTITGLIESGADIRNKDKALFVGETTISFKEIDKQANRLARYLTQTIQVEKGSLIGVCTGRNEQMLISLLAVVKSGAAYVPLDPAYPPARLEFIIGDAGLDYVICDTVDQLSGQKGITRVVLEELEQTLSTILETGIEDQSKPEDLAYLIYTSGSTGQPKGVEITHGNAATFLNWALQEFADTDFKTVYAVTSFCFDLSVFELFYPLFAGKNIRILNDGLDIEKWTGKDENILINTVPSVIAGLLASGTDLKNVTAINMAGEPVPLSIKEKLCDTVIQVRNLYGPSEDTTYSSCYTFDAKDDGVPMGRPVSNTRFYVLDDEQNLLPAGVPGELCIAGDQVSRGYRNRPVLTADKFIPNPFGAGSMYRTGDLVRWMPDGNMMFIGRNDSQIKLRGFRIELGEIEAALVTYRTIDKAAVILDGEGQDKRLIAYLETAEPVNEKNLTDHLKSIVPAHMLPQQFVSLAQLPLNANGKIDRKALPKPSRASAASPSVAAARNEREEMIRIAFSSLFPEQGVTVKDHFFQLGGDSLKAARLIARLEKEMGSTLDLRDLFENPTVEGLAAAINSSNGEEIKAPVPVPAQENYALSHAQKRLWVIDRFEGGQSAYNITEAYVLEGESDINALEKAFDLVYARHESLRTRIILQEGEPRQQIEAVDRLTLPWSVSDLADTDAADERVKEIARAEATRMFDLEKGPLLNIHLLNLRGEQRVLIITMHHIITDGWSLNVFFTEVLSAYNALRDGDEVKLPALPLQYKDYAHWQNDQLSGESLTKHRGYWVDQFKGEVPVLDLPTDMPRPARRTYNGASKSIPLGLELTKGLNKLARDNDSSLFMVLLSGIYSLMHRYTGQTDIVLGTPVAGRIHADLEPVIGMFLNNLPLRTSFNRQDSFEALLNKVRRTTLDGFAHQVYPFDKLVEDLDVERDMSRSPLYDVAVVLQNTAFVYDSSQEEALGLNIKGFDEGYTASTVDLRFEFTEYDGGLYLTLDYNTDLFTGQRIDYVLKHVEQLLSQVVENPTLAVALMDYLPQEEKALLLDEFGSNEREIPQAKLLMAHFEEIVDKYGERTALTWNDTTHTYAALNTLSNRLAHHLIQEKNLKPGDVAGVMLEKSDHAIISLLAIWKAGLVYVPVDPAFPQDRKSYMFQDTGMKMLMTNSEYLPALQGYEGEIFACDVEFDMLAEQEENLTLSYRTDDLAYILYTSGSTGRPKGVRVSHEGLLNMALDQVETLECTSKDKVLQFLSLTFDGSLADIFMAFACGANLVLIDKDVILDTGRFVRYVEEKAVSLAILPPAYLNVLRHHELPGIRTIVTAGEAAIPADMAHYGTSKNMRNSYGPTEATVKASMFKYEEADIISAVPIGRPSFNKYLYVLDSDDQLVPVGVRGELCIGGAGIALGYQNDPDLSRQKFDKDPLRDNGRIYRTGDMAKWRTDGQLEYLGRVDSMVNVQGHRVEPGEIEHALASVEGITMAVVVLTEEQKLAAYFTSGASLSLGQLKAALKQKLPAYMIPAYFVPVEAFEYNSNGKIDRRKLPLAKENALTGTRSDRHAETGTEQILLKWWQEVLKREDISMEDNFFDLGGDSLRLVQLFNFIEEAYPGLLEITDLFSNPTIEAQALLLPQEKEEEPSDDEEETIKVSF
ncbi:amino acid adenylation domain-containing protein [Roseivirga sp. BDSF3-8]|uniref:non-ribosomal peptide synthetase n=1 Tax=Roseivirga sp. BDSF3-8 TaxID=3241598 RepID=UPI003532324D